MSCSCKPNRQYLRCFTLHGIHTFTHTSSTRSPSHPCPRRKQNQPLPMEKLPREPLFPPHRFRNHLRPAVQSQMAQGSPTKVLMTRSRRDSGPRSTPCRQSLCVAFLFIGAVADRVFTGRRPRQDSVGQHAFGERQTEYTPCGA